MTLTNADRLIAQQLDRESARTYAERNEATVSVVENGKPWGRMELSRLGFALRYVRFNASPGAYVSVY